MRRWIVREYVMKGGQGSAPWEKDYPTKSSTHGPFLFKSSATICCARLNSNPLKVEIGLEFGITTQFFVEEVK